MSTRRKPQHHRPSPAAVAAFDQLEARNAEVFDRLRTALTWHLVGGLREGQATPELRAWVVSV